MTKTPQEMANQLVEEFWTEVEDNNYATRKMSLTQAKQCAWICVNQILEATEPFTTPKLPNWYWNAVKKEIELSCKQ
jgi:hypothetical protein